MIQNKIKAKRILKGFTQSQIAEVMSMKKQTYQLKERGISSFSDPEKVDLAIALDLTLQDVNDIFFDGRLPNG